jgi:hypothetical protein
MKTREGTIRQMTNMQPMEWTHSETIGLSSVRCTKCEGTGLRPGTHRDGRSPCNCVLRNIFRACLRRFYFCAANEPYRSKVTLMPCHGLDVNCTWTRTSEDYMADFYLVAKRVLEEDEFRIFRFHFLLSADWKLCCRRLNLDRGTFFHAVYRIEQKLGRAYREIRPYSLFPTDEYFGGTVRKAKVLTMPGPERTKPKPILRPPVRLAA